MRCLPCAVEAFPCDVKDAGTFGIAKAIPQTGRHVNVASFAGWAAVLDSGGLSNSIRSGNRDCLSAVGAVVVLRCGEGDEESRV